MKKLFALLLCTVMLLSMCSFAMAGDRVHITFSFLGK